MVFPEEKGQYQPVKIKPAVFTVGPSGLRRSSKKQVEHCPQSGIFSWIETKIKS
jgi:hypothetical protein